MTDSNSTKQRKVLIALGSNLGDRVEQVNRALEEIDAIEDTHLVATSRLYESKPWGDADQDNFINAACLIESSQTPDQLLKHLQYVECKLGKKVIRKWGPRKIDLDMLDYEGFKSESSDLELPHPRVKDRPFVLRPIHDLEKLTGCEYHWVETDEARKIADETWLYDKTDSCPLWNRKFSSLIETIEWNDLVDTENFAKEFASKLSGGECISLNGNLGSGKTTFIACLCKALGVQDQVSSPSYALCQEYRSKLGDIRHWDFYRLQDADDLESTGFFDQDHGRGLTLIEWGDLFADDLPNDSVRIEIQRADDSEKRTVKVMYPKGKSLQLRRMNSTKDHHEYSCS